MNGSRDHLSLWVVVNFSMRAGTILVHDCGTVYPLVAARSSMLARGCSLGADRSGLLAWGCSLVAVRLWLLVRVSSLGAARLGLLARVCSLVARHGKILSKPLLE